LDNIDPRPPFRTVSRALPGQSCPRAVRFSWQKLPSLPAQATPQRGSHATIFKPNWEKSKIMSDKDEQDELERLRRENAALKKGASPGARMKVSEKGALSIYGMGRFPVRS
jgi:hypothetical protein